MLYPHLCTKQQFPTHETHQLARLNGVTESHPSIIKAGEPLLSQRFYLFSFAFETVFYWVALAGLGMGGLQMRSSSWGYTSPLANTPKGQSKTKPLVWSYCFLVLPSVTPQSSPSGGGLCTTGSWLTPEDFQIKFKSGERSSVGRVLIKRT